MVEGAEMNLERLKQVIAYVKAHPEEYNQDLWCGTARCIAGHTVSLFGAEDFKEDVIRDKPQNLSFSPAEHRPSVKKVAQHLLGLDQSQANKLFIECRTLEDVEDLVAEFEADERVEKIDLDWEKKNA